ncbi:MAG: DUF5615 family PIN-like protein [Thermoanaerobaculia bacterium]
MKFLLDESTDFRAATHLRSLGHDVQSIARDYEQALADEQVLAIALRERWVLITSDTDFGELVFRLGSAHAGVMLIRLRSVEVKTLLSSLDYVLANHAHRLAEFVVVNERGVRFRTQAL